MKTFDRNFLHCAIAAYHLIFQRYYILWDALNLSLSFVRFFTSPHHFSLVLWIFLQNVTQAAILYKVKQASKHLKMKKKIIGFTILVYL